MRHVKININSGTRKFKRLILQHQPFWFKTGLCIAFQEILNRNFQIPGLQFLP